VDRPIGNSSLYLKKSLLLNFYLELEVLMHSSEIGLYRTSPSYTINHLFPLACKVLVFFLNPPRSCANCSIDLTKHLQILQFFVQFVQIIIFMCNFSMSIKSHGVYNLPNSECVDFHFQLNSKKIYINLLDGLCCQASNRKISSCLYS
jgi:hypothetical protein